MLLERLPREAGRWMIGALPRLSERPVLPSVGLTTRPRAIASRMTAGAFLGKPVEHTGVEQSPAPPRALGQSSPAPVLPRNKHIEMGATL
jgi:hypothetical protein